MMEMTVFASLAFLDRISDRKETWRKARLVMQKKRTELESIAIDNQ